MKKTIIISSIIVAILAIVVVVKYNAKTSLDTLYKKWGIELSESCKKIYYITSDTNFLGDGNYYTIFECDDFAMGNINIEWTRSKDKAFEDMILSNIAELPIERNYEINFRSEYEYFFKSESDGSELFIIHSLESNLIYVIENIM